ncbi:MAG: ECF-type sigma factor [Myxococcota bacterium]
MGDITALLQASADGDTEARNRVFELVYAELRTIAARSARKVGGAGTLDTTGLVHECYLRLAGAEVNTRGHFFALATTAMRQILCDHARRRTAQKRGAGARAASIEPDDIAVSESAAEELVMLDQLLGKLSLEDERAARVLEARVFGGLSVDETAEALGVSIRTVHNDTQRAKTWVASHWSA